jgi:hypothetical protein
MPHVTQPAAAVGLPYDSAAARELLIFLRRGGLNFSLHVSRNRGRWLVAYRDKETGAPPRQGEANSFAAAWPMNDSVMLEGKPLEDPCAEEQELLAAIEAAEDRFYLHVACYRDAWRVVLRKSDWDESADGHGATFAGAWSACQAAPRHDRAIYKCIEATQRIYYLSKLVGEFVDLTPTPTDVTWPAIGTALKIIGELAGNAEDSVYAAVEQAGDT